MTIFPIWAWPSSNRSCLTSSHMWFLIIISRSRDVSLLIAYHISSITLTDCMCRRRISVQWFNYIVTTRSWCIVIIDFLGFSRNSKRLCISTKFFFMRIVAWSWHISLLFRDNILSFTLTHVIKYTSIFSLIEWRAIFTRPRILVVLFLFHSIFYNKLYKLI